MSKKLFLGWKLLWLTVVLATACAPAVPFPVSGPASLTVAWKLVAADFWTQAAPKTVADVKSIRLTLFKGENFALPAGSPQIQDASLGQFTFGQVADGTYKAQATALDAGGADITKNGPAVSSNTATVSNGKVTYSQGNALSILLSLRDGTGGEVRVNLASLSPPQPVAYFLAELWDITNPGTILATYKSLDADATFKFSSLADGTYRVRASAYNSSDQKLSFSETSINSATVSAGMTTYSFGNKLTMQMRYDPIITTVAGGKAQFVNTPATSVGLASPQGLTVDSQGNVYIASSHQINRLTPDGKLTTLAGSRSSSFTGDGGLATAAQLNQPRGMSFDPAGNLYVADLTNHRVRKVTPAGTIATIAGTGDNNFNGDGISAVSAKLDSPHDTAFDSVGNLYISDFYNNRIRKVTPGGVISTFAGSGPTGFSSGGFSGDGGPATSAVLNKPREIAMDSTNNLYFVDYSNLRVRMVPAVSGTYFGINMTASNIYTIVGSGAYNFGGDGGPATSASFRSLYGIALDQSRNLYLTDGDNHRVRMVPAVNGTYFGTSMTAGNIYTIAGSGATGLGNGGFSGDGGSATSALLNQPWGIILDSAGNIYVADVKNNRVRLIAAVNGTYFGIPMTAGRIYTIAGNGTAGFSGDGGQALDAQFGSPAGIAFDPAGNYYFADTYNYRIRKVTPAGIISTYAGDGTQNYGGDGGAALSAQIAFPHDVATDSTGNLYLSSNYEQRIRMVAAVSGTYFGIPMSAGRIYTVAGSGAAGFGNGAFSGDGGLATSARLNEQWGVTLDNVNNLYIADYVNNRVRMVAAANGTYFGIPMTANRIYTVAGSASEGFGGDGGPATSASLRRPMDVAVDSAGNLYISDGWNNRVRMVAAANGTYFGIPMTANKIYTIAGGAASLGDGGPATLAKLDSPRGLLLDGSGNLYVSDWGNQRVRKVTPTGIISTFAGNGISGFAGDGGPLTQAQLSSPWGLAFDLIGNMHIVDSGNLRIRKVTRPF